MEITKVIEKITIDDIKKAIERYDKERELYDRNKKTAHYFVIDKNSGSLYLIKVLVALAYLISIDSKESYKSFNDRNKNYHGDIAAKELLDTKFKDNGEERFEVVVSLKDEVDQIDKELIEKSIIGSEREAVVKARVNQGTYRKLLLSKYGKCVICGMDFKEALIASHIKPWKDSLPEEKADVKNGLLLCPNHDKLFDRYLITFDSKGIIKISKHLNEMNRKCLCVEETDRLQIKLDKKCKEYLTFHNRLYEENEKTMNV